MTRRWLQSADVEIDEATGALLVQGDVGSTVKSPTSLAGGTKTVAFGGVPEPLVESSAPCQFVWAGARVDDYGASQNMGPCFVGDAAVQNIPVMMANYEGIVIRIDNAAKLYVRATNDGDGVVSRFFA